ncbi:MAG: sulfur oxidation c-type cytochrome SoxX [Rhodobacteraceae bacterium]|nr:sulfur oxidation c-type cytochrome SoxX [Paracoccaceae bacterium]
MKRLIVLGALVALPLCAAVATADTVPDAVKFDNGAVAQSLTGVAGDPADGLKVATTRPMGNCIACHVAAGWAKFADPGDIGPALDGVGSKYTEAQLRGIVANAKMTFPDTLMPSFYKTSGFIRPGDGYTAKAPTGPIQPILTAQQVEDVVAFLMTFK